MMKRSAQDAVNPVMVFFRSVFLEQLERLLPVRAKVVDLGCGMEDTPLFLAERGFSIQVLGCDDEQAARLRDEASRRGLGSERLRIDEARRLEPARVLGPLDAAYAFPDVLDQDELPRLCGALSRALTKRGVFLLTLPASGVGFGRIRRSPGLFPPLPADAALRFRPCCSLGWLMPGPAAAAWAQSHPQTFGLFAAFERLLRHRPLVRMRGRYTLWIGTPSCSAQ